MKALPLALGCLLAGICASTPARAAACDVASVQGTGAEILRGGDVPVPATAMMALDAGDRVRTRAGGRVVLLCDGGARVRIGPGTVLDIAAMAGGEAGWTVFLLDGIAGFLRPLFGTGRFEVRTPSAVASVRSTEWIVAVAARATAVFVEEGAVAVTARTGAVTLMPGEGVDVAADGTIGPVRIWGAGRVDRTRDRLAPRAE